MPDPTPYPEDVVAEAKVLAIQYGSSYRAADDLAVLYPDRHPDPRTIQVWLKDDPEALALLTQERKQHLQDRLYGIASKVLDRMDESADTIKGSQAFVAGGITIDKIAVLSREVGTSGDRPTGPIVMVFNAAKPETVQVDVIDGEVVGEA